MMCSKPAPVSLISRKCVSDFLNVVALLFAHVAAGALLCRGAVFSAVQASCCAVSVEPMLCVSGHAHVRERESVCHSWKQKLLVPHQSSWWRFFLTLSVKDVEEVAGFMFKLQEWAQGLNWSRVRAALM